MTNVVTVSSFQKLDNEHIEFYDEHFIVDSQNNTVTFTEVGSAYYRGWFRRFGFPTINLTADMFIEQVRAINKICWDNELAAGGALTDELEELWAKKDFPAFLDALESQASQATGAVVVALPQRRVN